MSTVFSATPPWSPSTDAGDNTGHVFINWFKALKDNKQLEKVRLYADGNTGLADIEVQVWDDRPAAIMTAVPDRTTSTVSPSGSGWYDITISPPLELVKDQIFSVGYAKKSSGGCLYRPGTGEQTGNDTVVLYYEDGSGNTATNWGVGDAAPDESDMWWGLDVVVEDVPQDRTGSASGGVSWSGSVSGSTIHRGTTGGGFAWAGGAVGGAPHAGTASGGFAWAGVASGSKPGLLMHSGTVDGTVLWTGEADGHAPVAAHHSGSASGTLVWAGDTVGSAPHRGTADGTVMWHGEAGSGVNRNITVVVSPVETGWHTMPATGNAMAAREPTRSDWQADDLVNYWHAGDVYIQQEA